MAIFFAGSPAHYRVRLWVIKAAARGVSESDIVIKGIHTVSADKVLIGDPTAGASLGVDTLLQFCHIRCICHNKGLLSSVVVHAEANGQQFFLPERFGLNDLSAIVDYCFRENLQNGELKILVAVGAGAKHLFHQFIAAVQCADIVAPTAQQAAFAV